jgi:endoribonuclease Dicer
MGSMGLDLWSKEIWDRTLSESMIVVCTAYILDQCILNSYIRMENINLLIFDEAHHAKKDHAYARSVYHDFYHFLNVNSKKYD